MTSSTIKDVNHANSSSLNETDKMSHKSATIKRSVSPEDTELTEANVTSRVGLDFIQLRKTREDLQQKTETELENAVASSEFIQPKKSRNEIVKLLKTSTTSETEDFKFNSKFKPITQKSKRKKKKVIEESEKKKIKRIDEQPRSLTPVEDIPIFSDVEEYQFDQESDDSNVTNDVEKNVPEKPFTGRPLSLFEDDSSGEGEQDTTQIIKDVLGKIKQDPSGKIQFNDEQDYR